MVRDGETMESCGGEGGQVDGWMNGGVDVRGFFSLACLRRHAQVSVADSYLAVKNSTRFTERSRNGMTIVRE